MNQLNALNRNPLYKCDGPTENLESTGYGDTINLINNEHI